MKKYKLDNGIKVLFEKNFSKTVAVEVMVGVGSNYETKDTAGISHFLEHMLFEGTKKRKNSLEIANEIEKYGAEFNAYTSGDRTAYFIKIINKKFEKALEILSDMFSNSVFDPKMVKKEQDVVVKELNMVTDDPRQHQWILFQKNLWDWHPEKNPTIGNESSIKSFDRSKVVDYFKKYYVPGNMVVSIAGNADGVKRKVEKHFSKLKPEKYIPRKRVFEKKQNKVKNFVEERKMQNSYMVLGYQTANRLHKDSYVLDIINGILGRGQSGWIFNEIRNKRGLAYQAGVQLENSFDFGYFAVYVGLEKKNINLAKRIILEQFDRLKKLTEKELNEAKTYVEGNYALTMEDNFHLADNIAFWETIKDADLVKNYIKNIKKVSVSDVKRVVKKYFDGKYTLVVIKQK
jgi:predicted Zn-dependent peptidase